MASVENFQGPEVPTTYSDVVLVLDNSGSINESELVELKVAAKALIDGFFLHDVYGARIGITRFRGSSAPVHDMSVDAASLKAAIDGLIQGGPGLDSGTNMVAGLQGGGAQFSSGPGDRPEAANKIIFITDGNDTVTSGSKNAVIAKIEAAAMATGAEVFAIGVAIQTGEEEENANFMDTLKAIAFDPDVEPPSHPEGPADHVFMVDDFANLEPLLENFAATWSGPLLPSHMVPGDYAGGPASAVKIETEDGPTVLFSVLESDADLDHPCPPVDGVGRQQVKWEFIGDAPPEVLAGLRAEIVLLVSATALAPDIYYNEMFWEASRGPTVLDDFTCGVGPVYARFRQWDIISSAGGTTLNARSTILGGPDYDLAIRSWQIDDGEPLPVLPDNSSHVAFLCGRGLPAGGPPPLWEAYIQVTVHDKNHDPLENATVTGDWSEFGFGHLGSCTTDAVGRCKVSSGTLNWMIKETTFFSVDHISHATSTDYLPEYDEMSEFAANRPKSAGG